MLNECAGVLAAPGDDPGAELHDRRALALHRACCGDVDVRVAQDENDLGVWRAVPGARSALGSR